MENNKIYTYRYIWLIKNNDKLNVRIISGIKEEHEQFVKVLLDNVDVEKASRVYVCEYDIVKMDDYEPVKQSKEENQNEEISQ